MKRTNDKGTKPYDQAFKYFAENDARSLLILLGFLSPDQVVSIKMLPGELSVSALLPDHLYKVKIGNQWVIVHIEAQTVYDPKLPERITEYAARVWMKYRLPVFSFILLLTKRRLRKDVEAFGLISAGDLRISMPFGLVRLWELSARDMLDMNRQAVLPFIPLMRGGKPELEDAAVRLGKVRTENKKRELALHFLLLGGIRYNRADLLELIGRKAMIALEQLKGSSIYQWIIEEGLKEGLERGLEQGIRKGVREGEVHILERLLSNRFGKLDSALIERMNRLTSEQLDALTDDIWKLNTREDVVAWFDSLPVAPEAAAVKNVSSRRKRRN